MCCFSHTFRFLLLWFLLLQYNCLKVIVQRRRNAVIGPMENLAVGAVAGVVNVLLTTPLWAVSTRLAVQRKKKKRAGKSSSKSRAVTNYKGMADGLVRISRQNGVLSLWDSVVPNLILVSNPTIHFFTYERVRIVMMRIAKARGTPLSSWEFFLMGALGKAVATVFTYPLQIVQSQLRNDRNKKYSGTIDCLFKVYQVAGLSGLFRGFFAKLWQTVLTAAFQFMTFEKMRVIVKASLLTFSQKGQKTAL